MKKLTALLLALLLPAVSALADTDLSGYSVTNAVVQAAHTADITAPCAGTLLPFEIEAGDEAASGDVLFSLMTEDVYAQENGKVAAVFVKAGDSADAVMNRYGSLGAVEPDTDQLLNCTTAEAYDNDDNKTLHVGETLYFKSRKSGGEEGSGRVIAVTAAGYTVEILKGDFSLNEKMNLYRDDDYGSRDCVGKGTVVLRQAMPFYGTGLVTKVYVHSGSKVKAGDRLLSVLPGTDDRSVSPDISAPESGVIGAVAVQPGQQVWKGELLCRMYLTNEMEAVADVDEMDLGDLGVGSAVYVTLDTDKDHVITGQITQISSLGVTRGNAAYYTVHVSLPGNETFMLGQSASLYLPMN